MLGWHGPLSNADFDTFLHPLSQSYFLYHLELFLPGILYRSMAAYDKNEPVYAEAVVMGELATMAVVAEVVPDTSPEEAKVASGVAAATVSTAIFDPPACSEREAVQGLVQRGMPQGLAEVVWGSSNDCAIR